MNTGAIPALSGDGDEVHDDNIGTNMLPFTTVSGPAVPLMRTNVDTDLIIRIERMTGPAKSELGTYALETLRYRDDGSLDPDCVLNRPIFRNAPILLGGDNLGAIMNYRYFFRGNLRKSFAEIFLMVVVYACYSRDLSISRGRCVESAA